MIRILIGGDVCPMGGVQEAFTAGRGGDIFHDLCREIQSANLSLVNLECPLVSKLSPIEKAAPVLGAPSECIRGFVDAGWHGVNLANNHSFDHGAAGLNQTLATVRGAGLAVVGAGADLSEANTPLIRQIDGQRVVIYSMAERELSIADESTPGANPLDLIRFIEAVRFHKQGGVFITLIHGGKEYYPYPSPEVVRRCRFMIDMGADAVICCHTHCPLPWETYADRPIAYGLGNLIFEPLTSEPRAWHQGYLARLEIEQDKVRFEPIPYIQSLGAGGAVSMGAAAASVFLEELRVRSEELKDPAILAAKWGEFCRSQRMDYLAMLFASSPRLFKLKQSLMPIRSKQDVSQALLMVQCETHREVLETIFKDERLGH